MAELCGDLDEGWEGHARGAVGRGEGGGGGEQKLEPAEGLRGGVAALGELLVEIVEEGPEDLLQFGDHGWRGGGLLIVHVAQVDQESLGGRLALGTEDQGTRAETGKAFGAEVLLDGLEVGPEGLGVLGGGVVLGVDVSSGKEGVGGAVEGVVEGEVGDAVAGVAGEEDQGGVLLVLERAGAQEVQEVLLTRLAGGLEGEGWAEALEGGMKGVVDDGWPGVCLPEGRAFGHGGGEGPVPVLGGVEQEGSGVVELDGGEGNAEGAIGEGASVGADGGAEGDAEGGVEFNEGGGEVLSVVEEFGVGGFRVEEVEGEEVEVGGEEDVLALGGRGFLGDEVLGWGVVEDDVFEVLEVGGDVGERDGHVWSVRVLGVACMGI
ncbi:hypothetical protein ASF71_21090 [Deinococcus sp. Leaf326]|nr:hypothetical protein ASF71_21090 [Deinococcus sp. Leaf326]